MSSVYFVGVDKIEQLLIDNDVTRWHVAHGWVWNVVDAGGGPLGVLYATLLCGSGAVIHFESISGGSPAQFIGALRKTIRMLSGVLDVLYATIPESKNKLIRVLRRYGFALVQDGWFVSDGQKIELLKYIKNQNTRL